MVISFTATLLVIHLCVTSKSDKSSGHPELVPSSLVAQMVKNLPAVQEIWVRSLGLEDTLEKEMAIFLLFQYSCLENPTDRGA